MIRNELLLQENPPYVLAPDIDLTRNIVTKPDKENGKEGLFNCDGCGKALDSEYYISIGIPPSPLIIETYRCESLNHEKNIEFEKIVAGVQSKSKAYDLDSKYQWIFSEQNIMDSRTRLCVNCKEEFKWGGWRGWEIPGIHVDRVCFAVKEYQRRHTPISTAKSDYERYILSLPDRTNLSWQHFGDVDLNAGFATTYYMTDMIECLTIALIPDYKPANQYYTNLSQELLTKIIQDKNRVIPNDQELTRWMRKHFDLVYNRDRCEWYTIQFCKIFMNPKSLEHPKRLDDGKEVYNTRYTVVVHYSVPKGDWQEYDI